LLATLLAALAACAGSADASRHEGGPQRDETLSIASFSTYALHPVATSVSCRLARDASEWAKARNALGAAGLALPERPCAFSDDAAVLVVLPMRVELATLSASMSTEEGVDVLTIAQQFEREPPGADPIGRAFLSQAALVVVPQRPRQLAVVLRTMRAESIGEETIAVLDGAR
jgi:hypothetical protein